MSQINSNTKHDFQFVLAYCHVSWDTLYVSLFDKLEPVLALGGHRGTAPPLDYEPAKKDNMRHGRHMEGQNVVAYGRLPSPRSLMFLIYCTPHP